jgi:hypothetical protein
VHKLHYTIWRIGVALSSQVSSILSFLFSLVFAFRAWPGNWSYLGSLVAIALFILFFCQWIWKAFSMPLYEISTSSFRWQQIGFNAVLIAVIVAGEWFFPPATSVPPAAIASPSPAFSPVPPAKLPQRP